MGGGASGLQNTTEVGSDEIFESSDEGSLEISELPRPGRLDPQVVHSLGYNGDEGNKSNMGMLGRLSLFSKKQKSNDFDVTDRRSFDSILPKFKKLKGGNHNKSKSGELINTRGVQSTPPLVVNSDLFSSSLGSTDYLSYQNEYAKDLSSKSRSLKSKELDVIEENDDEAIDDPVSNDQEGGSDRHIKFKSGLVEVTPSNFHSPHHKDYESSPLLVHQSQSYNGTQNKLNSFFGDGDNEENEEEVDQSVKTSPQISTPNSGRGRSSSLEALFGSPGTSKNLNSPTFPIPSPQQLSKKEDLDKKSHKRTFTPPAPIITSPSNSNSNTPYKAKDGPFQSSNNSFLDVVVNQSERRSSSTSLGKQC